jgi:hypothetical protein
MKKKVIIYPVGPVLELLSCWLYVGYQVWFGLRLAIGIINSVEKRVELNFQLSRDSGIDGRIILRWIFRKWDVDGV